MVRVDTTIRNLDERAYRALKAQAALSGKTIGQLVNDAIHAYLGRPGAPTRPRSLRQLHPEPYPEGNETLSEDIDRVVYGA
jgi:hypothetical protein